MKCLKFFLELPADSFVLIFLIHIQTLQTPRRSAIDFEGATNLKVVLIWISITNVSICWILFPVCLFNSHLCQDITKLILSSSSEMNRGDGIVDRKPKPVTRSESTAG